MDCNSVILIGKVTAAGPKISWNDKGAATCTFWLQVDERGKDGQVFSTYLPVEIIGKQAEDLAGDLTPGEEVCVQGKLKYKSTGTRDGKKTGTIVVSTWFVTKAPAPTVPQDARTPGRLEDTQGDAWGAGPPAAAETKKGKPRYPKWRAPAESPN